MMSVPILGLSLGYMYHPSYPSPKNEVPRGAPLPCDPTQWEPDVISLELEAGPAALRMFGSLMSVLAAIKVCAIRSNPDLGILYSFMRQQGFYNLPFGQAVASMYKPKCHFN